MTWRRRRPVPERASFAARDLIAEALAGILQRPARSVLTAVGTILGVGAFVAVLGLTSTATGQISKQFNVLTDTTVTVADVGPNPPAVHTGPGGHTDFPDDADQRVDSLNGVTSAGVYWTIPVPKPVIAASAGITANSSANEGALPVYAASPGLFATIGATITGRAYDAFHQACAQHVAVLGEQAARALGIAQLSAQPAIFINGVAYTVVGIATNVRQLPAMLLGIMIPTTTAQDLYPLPNPANNPAQMVIQTRLGAANLIARQAPRQLQPDHPDLLQATPPPDPRSLQNNVNTDLEGLFLVLAAISLVIGAVGIASTTLVAVMERIGEIGLRRSIGARPRHIAAQFLAESMTLGTIGGLIGTAVGVGVVVGVALAKDWTAILNPAVVLPSPLIGTVVGMIAGLYPAVRAAATEPLDALRR